MLSILFGILTGDDRLDDASDMLWFLLNSKEMIEIGPKDWFFGSFWQVCLRPLTPYELRPKIFFK